MRIKGKYFLSENNISVTSKYPYTMASTKSKLFRKMKDKIA